MTSRNTARVVLGDLNTNLSSNHAPTAKSLEKGPGIETRRAEEPRDIPEGKSAPSSTVKRPLEAVEEGQLRSTKRKTKSREQPTISDFRNDALSSGSASPASSIASSALDDSENTVITEPDIPSTQLTQNELRQRARAMRLRLRLAAYKVQSNQMDIPISELKIKPSPTSPKLPPLSRRTPLPSAIPNIKLQRPSVEKPRPLTNLTSSPPRSYSTMTDASPLKDSFATPILPRQHQSLLNPPNLGSPAWKDGDLTSSAIKGKAADSLLSLMYR